MSDVFRSVIFDLVESKITCLGAKELVAEGFSSAG